MSVLAWMIGCIIFLSGESFAESHWTRLPPVSKRTGGVSDIAIDESSVLWGMVGGSFCFWDGSRFQRLQNPPFGAYGASFYGGSDRGLYVVQAGPRPRRGLYQGLPDCGIVYRLSREQVTRITDCKWGNSRDFPGFYVAKDGWFLNWTGKCVRVFDRQQWHETTLDPNNASPIVLDAGGTVHLYCNGTLYSSDISGNIERRVLHPPDRQPQAAAALWSIDRAIFIHRYAPSIRAYNLSTGDPVPVNDINASISQYSLMDLCSAPDGSVWILASTNGQNGYFLCIHPDGSVNVIRGLAGLPRNIFNMNTGYMPSILFEDNGSAWICFPQSGVIHYTNGQMKQFDYRQGDSPSDCRRFVRGSDDSVYAVSDWWLYTYRSGESPDSNAGRQYPPIHSDLEIVWQVTSARLERLERAWPIGDSIVYTTSQNNQVNRIVSLDSRTGLERFQITPGPSWRDDPWIAQGHTPKHLLLLGSRVATLDAQTGETVSQLDLRCSRFMEPVLVDGDYVTVRQDPDFILARVSPWGEQRWTCTLPGSLAAHPVACGPLMFIQTRAQSSFRGEASLAVDLQTGTQLWSDMTNAWGRGVCFAADGQYAVEGDTVSSSRIDEGWLIARNPRTGERLWHHRQPENGLLDSPVCDSTQDRVYAAFEGGEIVCLDGKTGEALWQTLLPNQPRSAVAIGHGLYWPSIALVGRLLIVVDRNDLIYVLDTDSGRVRARLDLTGSLVGANMRMGSEGLIGMPSIVGDAVIVPTPQRITAYSLLGVLE